MNQISEGGVGGSGRPSPTTATSSRTHTPSRQMPGGSGSGGGGSYRGLRPDDYPQNTQAPMPPAFQNLRVAASAAAPPPGASGYGPSSGGGSGGMPMYTGASGGAFPPYERDPQITMPGGPPGPGGYFGGGAGSSGPEIRRRESMPDPSTGQQHGYGGGYGSSGARGPMGGMGGIMGGGGGLPYPDMRVPMGYPPPAGLAQSGMPGSRPGSAGHGVQPGIPHYSGWTQPFGGTGMYDLPPIPQMREQAQSHQHQQQNQNPQHQHQQPSQQQQQGYSAGNGPSRGKRGSGSNRGAAGGGGGSAGGTDDETFGRRMSGPQGSDVDGGSSRPNSAGRPLGTAPAGMSSSAAGGGGRYGAMEGDSDGEGLVPKMEPVDDGDDKLDHRKRKRNRTIRSCVPCHNHKRKCDRKRPCGRCTALGLTGTCVYEVDEVRDPNDPDEIEADRLRRRVAELEQVVRELRQRNHHHRPATGGTSTAPGSLSATPAAGSGDPAGSAKRRVIVDRFARFKIDEAAAAAAAAGEGVDDSSPEATQPRPNATGPDAPGRLDADSGGGGGAYGAVSAPTQSDHPDMGKKDYKLEPYRTHLLPGEEMVYDRSGRKTFLGAPAGKSMMRRLRELMSQKSRGSGANGDEDLLSVPEDVAFMGQFPDMRKTFPFTTIWSHENFSGEIIGLLPNQEQAEVLWEAFSTDILPFFLAWHVPTLEAEYRRFFEMSTIDKMNVPLSALALYLMICSLGCVIRASKAEIFGQSGIIVEDPTNTAQPRSTITRDPKDLTSSRLQSELYLSAAYQALRLCSFLSNPTIYTIQAQILVNVYLLNSERAADAWSQTGSLIRQCIAMGLHVDPASLDPRISLRDAEIRRRVWWTVAGLDALFCVSFGRPSAINFYTTNLPQDRTDNNLPEIPGSAQAPLPPSNVLRNETTDNTYHTAYFSLTIPSYELLDRIFHTEWTYSRSAIYGWFSRAHDDSRTSGAGGAHPGETGSGPDERGGQNTYEGSIRLAKDILEWYTHLPDGMRFEPDGATTEALVRSRSPIRVNQTLVLCVKTFMIILCLQRPYLRLDPSAYPESTEICFNAAHTILKAYSIASQAHSSVFWTWWTMTFRAFHAAAVVAFLSIRQPGTDLARRCLADLRDAVAVFEDRVTTWNIAHPVQADLLNGLCRLERLAKAASRQNGEQQYGQGSNGQSSGMHAQQQHPQPQQGPPNPLQPPPPHHAQNNVAAGGIPTIIEPEASTTHPGSPIEFGARTPLSQIKAFPMMGATSPAAMAQVYNTGMGMGMGVPGSGNRPSSAGGDLLGLGLYAQQPDALGFQGDGFSGAESFALPAMWASMFGIKLDGSEPGSGGL